MLILIVDKEKTQIKEAMKTSVKEKAIAEIKEAIRLAKRGVFLF